MDVRRPRLALAVGASLLAFGACGGPPVSPSITARAHGDTSSRRHETKDTATPERARGRRHTEQGDAAIVGEYSVRYDGASELVVEATLVAGSDVLAVERAAEPFVEGFEVASAAGRPWTKGSRDGASFVAGACASSACRIRYRYRLRDAAKSLDDLDVASEEGAVVEAPPSTWLLAPTRREGGRLRFRVETTADTSFHTGVFRARGVDRAWDIALADLWTAPYSVFGPLRSQALEEHGLLDLAIVPGTLRLGDDALATWTRTAARSVASYFGSFPLPEALVVLVPARGSWVGEGKTLSGGGGSIFLRVGETASAAKLREDWVLVHEMVHLAFPSVAREHDWAEEGLATYVEPIARARAGQVSPESAWFGLVEGLPKGLPLADDRGLDRTPTWGRTYWGGALFYLLADIDLRKRSSGRLGLEHALRGILASGGNNTRRWTLEETFDAGDAATGLPVLRELHAAMGTAPYPVDLAALWRDLGVVRARATVRFDDAAPLAATRRAIMTAN